jgi:hypothetical protein
MPTPSRNIFSSQFFYHLTTPLANKPAPQPGHFFINEKKKHKAETETAMILGFWAIVNFVLEHFND